MTDEPVRVAPDADADAGADTAAADAQRARRVRWARIGGVGMVLAMAALWAYAFLVPQDVPGRMDDTTFPTAAEPVCAKAKDALGAVPRSIEVTDSAERAALVEQGTSILTGMVDELEALVPTSQPAQQMVTEWLQDWRAYLTNRQDYATRLRSDPDARFYVDQSDRDGKQITNALDRFAEVNRMPSCTVPDDVG